MALDIQDAEDRYRLEPVDALTPEKVFAARWAMALLGETMNRLCQEYAIGHNAVSFETLKADAEMHELCEALCYVKIMVKVTSL